LLDKLIRRDTHSTTFYAVPHIPLLTFRSDYSYSHLTLSKYPLSIDRQDHMYPANARQYKASLEAPIRRRRKVRWVI